jgi:hypothetical protein
MDLIASDLKQLIARSSYVVQKLQRTSILLLHKYRKSLQWILVEFLQDGFQVNNTSVSTL